MHGGGAHDRSRRLYRRALADVPERFIRHSTAALVPCFGVIAVLATLSPEGPAGAAHRIIVAVIYLSTIPVGIGVARMRFGKAWQPYRLTRARPWTMAFVVYADIGVSGVLLTFADHETALFGTALFSIIGVFAAGFTVRSVVVGHVVVTSITITALALLTWRQGQHDSAAIVARWLTSLLAVNSTPLILNAFTSGLQKSFDTQLDSATKDPLTGLLNRRGLELWTDALLRTHPPEVGFILVDLDHFKSINDCHGHAAGDDVLVCTAQRLQASVGDGGLLARTGGEEFTVVLTHPDSIALAHALRAAIHRSDDAIPLTASIGVATLAFNDIVQTDPVDPLREGQRRADIALYEAKRAGRNRVRAYQGFASDPPGEVHSDEN